MVHSDLTIHQNKKETEMFIGVVEKILNHQTSLKKTKLLILGIIPIPNSDFKG